MCGLLATLNYPEEAFREGLKLISHRGPDAEGSLGYEGLWLGHRRLSIQDLSEEANQPMLTEDEKYVIIFNGEIYNHWELRENLKQHPFRTESDTETLLVLFREHGVKAFNMLNGIFALVILDKEQGRITVARDHFGVKPLYYSHNNNHFACSSELKALLPLVKDRSMDIGAIQNYLSFMWSPGEKTPFQKVRKLLPGTYLQIDLIDPEGINFVRYYQLKFPNQFEVKGFDIWVNELEEQLIRAVKRQLLSDAPIGFFLSGGLDSSLLVAIAKKLRPDQRLKCYTIDTGESKDGFANDLDYARQVAKYLDVDLSEINIQSDVLEIFDEVLWHLDEPQSDPAPFNVMRIAEAAQRDGIKVLIGGTGGDDIFSGYRRHQALLINSYVDRAPHIIRLAVRRAIQNIKSKGATVRRLKKLTRNLDSSREARMVGYFEWQNTGFIRQLFREELRGATEEKNEYFYQLLQNVENIDSDLNRILYLEVYTFLVDHNLNYTDKAGMAKGVEIRVPYLDLELVEFSTRIPPEFKMKGKQTKYILRKVAERYLPHEVIYRPKSGFGAPVEYWIREELRGFIDTRLSRMELEKYKLLDVDAVRQMIQDNQTGKINASYNVWSILALQSWMKLFAHHEK